LVKNFLAKKNVTTRGHSPYSPDFATADFYLFTQLKPALKARGFCDATDIIKNVTEELKRLSKNRVSGMFTTYLPSLAEV
jgi:hypothetical protein